MSETRVAPPLIPSEIKKDPREISDAQRQEAQARAGKKRNESLYGLTKEQREEMGKGWQKAHGELDYMGRPVTEEKPEAKADPKEKKATPGPEVPPALVDAKTIEESRARDKLVMARRDPATPNVGPEILQQVADEETERDQAEQVIINLSNEAERIRREDPREKRRRESRAADQAEIARRSPSMAEPLSADEAARRANADLGVSRLSQEAGRIQLETSREYRPIWVRFMKPIEEKIQEAVAANKPVYFTKDDMDHIEVFIRTAQRKLLSDREVREFVKRIANLPPHSLLPPNIPGVVPRLNEAWLKYNNFSEALKSFRPREQISLMSYNLDQVKSLEKTMSEAYSLFPSTLAA